MYRRRRAGENSKSETRIVTRRAARFARAPAGVVGARRLRRGERVASRRLTTWGPRARRRGETRTRKRGRTRVVVRTERIRKNAFGERRRTLARRRRSGARRGVARRGAGRPLLRRRGRFARRLRVRLRGKKKPRRRKHRKRNRRPRGPAFETRRNVRGANARRRFGVSRRGFGRQRDARLVARRERSR